MTWVVLQRVLPPTCMNTSSDGLPVYQPGYFEIKKCLDAQLVKKGKK